MPEITELLTWIESHGTTVDLIKWLVVGILAWLLGVFRFLHTRLKRPSLEIESFTSRCAWEDIGEVDGNPSNARVTILIEAGINNPTTSPIFIRDFTLQVKRLKKWPLWGAELNPTTLPCRVRHAVGDVTKYLKNWFSNYDEGSDNLTLDARINDREFQSGFIMFVSASWGNMLPRVVNGKILVRMKARLTTGEILVAKARIHILEDNSVLEALLPGLFAHAENPATWNIIRCKP